MRASKTRRRSFQWIEFNGLHAFLRDEGPRYDPVLARLCLSSRSNCFTAGFTAGTRPPEAAQISGITDANSVQIPSRTVPDDWFALSVDAAQREGDRTDAPGQRDMMSFFRSTRSAGTGQTVWKTRANCHSFQGYVFCPSGSRSFDYLY